MNKCKDCNIEFEGAEWQKVCKKCYALSKAEEKIINNPNEVRQILGEGKDKKIQKMACVKVAAVLVASANAKEETKISVLELTKTAVEVSEIIREYVNKVE